MFCCNRCFVVIDVSVLSVISVCCNQCFECDQCFVVIEVSVLSVISGLL